MTVSKRRQSQGELESSSSGGESPTAPGSLAVSRPVATHQHHEIKSGQRPRDHTTCSAASSRDTPGIYHGDDTSEADENERRNSDAASGFYNQQLPQSQPDHQPSGVTVRVKGVDFEVLSSTILPPPPVRPIPSPTPPPDRGRGQQRTPVSRRPSRSPSPGYGAWQPDFDQPAKRRRSILERAQARIERGFEHLVKAGRRPPPSFKVHSVVKSSRSGGEDEGVPVPAEEHMGEDNPSPNLGHTSLPLTTHIEDGGNESGKSVNPESYNGRSDTDSKPLPESPPLPFESGNGDVDKNEADEPDSERTSEDSLFFIPKSSKMRDSTASASFFSSDYARRQLDAIGKRYELEEEGKQDSETPPQRQSSASHEEDGTRTDRFEELTREQIEFASLPSAMEDLQAPFPLDDRRGLPSQTRRRPDKEKTD